MSSDRAASLAYDQSRDAFDFFEVLRQRTAVSSEHTLKSISSVEALTRLTAHTLALAHTLADTRDTPLMLSMLSLLLLPLLLSPLPSAVAVAARVAAVASRRVAAAPEA